MILASLLTANYNNYDINTGWRFNYSGVLKSVGYAGFWSARIGGLQGPTSDNPDDIGYISTATLGSVNGQVMDEGDLIQFTFTNVKIGKILPYRLSLGSYSVGDKLTSSRVTLYDATYEKCYYKRITGFTEAD